jgi:hypothetical protein
MVIIKLSHQDPASWLIIKWSLLYYFVLHLVPFAICVCIASFSRASSTDMFRGFAKSFPSLLVSNYTSYFFPFNSSFLHIFFILLPKPFGVFLCVSTLCSGLQAIMAYLSYPILTTCPNHLKFANFIISLMIIIPNPILVFWFLILFLLVFYSIFRSYLISPACNRLLR